MDMKEWLGPGEGDPLEVAHILKLFHQRMWPDEVHINIFNNLPALAPPKAADLGLEVDRYLSLDVEHVTDPLAWWHARRTMYPQLSHMALNYLSIPGKSALDFKQPLMD